MLVNSKRLQSAAILTHTWRFYFLQAGGPTRRSWKHAMFLSICRSPHSIIPQHAGGNKLTDCTCSTIYRTPIFKVGIPGSRPSLASIQRRTRRFFGRSECSVFRGLRAGLHPFTRKLRLGISRTLGWELAGESAAFCCWWL